MRNYCDKNEQLMSLKYRYQLTIGTIASVAAWAKGQKRKKDAAVMAASAARYSEPVNHAFDADFGLELELPEVKFSLDEPGTK